MYFSSLKLSQFRNYASLTADFSAGINAITGNNGAGKTNVLEAIHYLAMTRGFNRRSESYALMENMPYFMVEGSLLREEEEDRIQCTYMPPKGKKILVNKQPLKKMSDHVGSIPLVVVLPNDTQLIYGSPSVRRKFMDGFISQYDRSYLESLIQYEKAVDQRNALLNQFHERRTWDETLLCMWDENLIRFGQYLHNARLDFLNEFKPIFQRFFRRIVSEKEVPEIVLDSQLEQNTVEEWKELFQRHRDKDRYSQRTSMGSHKEDLVFTIDGQGVKHFGSQGQQKTFVIGLKFSQYEILENRTGKSPLLLLDDIFDKLDIHRLSAISHILHEEVSGQVFVTDTSLIRCQQVFSEVEGREVSYFGVEAGRLTGI